LAKAGIGPRLTETLLWRRWLSYESAGDCRAPPGHSRRFRCHGPATVAAAAMGPTDSGRFFGRLYAAGRRRAAGSSGNGVDRDDLRGRLPRPPPCRVQCIGVGRSVHTGHESGRFVQCGAAAFLFVRRRTDGDGAFVDGDGGRSGSAGRRSAAVGIAIAEVAWPLAAATDVVRTAAHRNRKAVGAAAPVARPRVLGVRASHAAIDPGQRGNLEYDAVYTYYLFG